LIAPFVVAALDMMLFRAKAITIAAASKSIAAKPCAIVVESVVCVGRIFEIRLQILKKSVSYTLTTRN